MHVITEIDPNSGALFARNRTTPNSRDRVAFFDVDDATRTVSGDRTEFLGRNGTLRNPAAMYPRRAFPARWAPVWIPAPRSRFASIWPTDRSVRSFSRLGVGRDADDASNLEQRFRGSTAAARDALEAVWQYWTHTLGAVQVETPDQSLNVLTNGWLLYQTLACRLWARSGYYQSGGAFGFRDQLQDVMALIHAEPDLVREHLLLCASRQFLEGDVQHWWHPPSGRACAPIARTITSGCRLATCRYVLATGDTGVLDEPVHFLEGRPVNAEEDSYYDLPSRSEEAARLI